jgi:hypothetical protein
VLYVSILIGDPPVLQFLLWKLFFQPAAELLEVLYGHEFILSYSVLQFKAVSAVDD